VWSSDLDDIAGSVIEDNQSVVVQHKPVHLNVPHVALPNGPTYAAYVRTAVRDVSVLALTGH